MLVVQLFSLILPFLSYLDAYGIHDCTPFCSRGLIVGLGGLIEFVHAAEDVGWEFETGFFQTIFKVGTEACTFQRTAT